MIFGNGKTERTSPVPYSKFANLSATAAEAKVPSKIGMLMIYVPATIVAFVFQFILPQLAMVSHKPTTAGFLVFAHFLKRDAEVLFLHKYSGDVERVTATAIGISYAITALMICLLSKPFQAEAALASGPLLFAVGSLGNLYHHYLLARLRSKGTSNSKTKEYRAPSGGLFEYVAAPHYFFELVAWAGIAVASQQITSYLNLLAMSAYLVARSN